MNCDMSAADTRTQILDAALAALPAEGFEGLSIGRLATRTGLSKSGLFAHFGGQARCRSRLSMRRRHGLKTG